MKDSLTLEFDGDPELTGSLSPRERQLLVMATNGLTDQAIAHALGISLATVSTYWGRVRVKFGPHPRTELVATFLRGEMARSKSVLAASEARFRTLLESSPLGIVLTDASGKILYVNAVYEAITGLSREALLSEDSWTCLHPEDQDRVVELWRRCIQDELPYSSEHRYQHADGTVVWVHSRGNVWHQDGMSGRVSVIEDVTANHEARQAQGEAEGRYRTLLALAPEAILSIDESLRIVEFNPGAERMFGYSAEEALGRPLSELIPNGLSELLGNLQERTTNVTSCERRVGRRKGLQEFACEVSIIREVLEDRTLFTAILRDLTT